jgi:asparagine synthase (glutamine-hydrolysing)
MPKLHKQCLDALTPRGPDVTQSELFEHDATGHTVAVGFTRLHIRGTAGGPEQPFRLSDSRLVLCNGEIFNSDILIPQLGLKVPEGASDCAVIPALLSSLSLSSSFSPSLADVARLLDGDFAITVVALNEGYIEVARDPYGVRPLYFASKEGEWSGIVSELKAMPPDATTVHLIQPGTTQRFWLDGRIELPKIWHQVPWLKVPFWGSSVDGLTAGGVALRDALTEAVAKRLSTVRDIGACLSGGLDSSLVAAIAAKLLAAQGKRLHTYSVGMRGSTDLAHARLVANHIGSVHHERVLTAEECLAAIPNVVKAIETFDITTVRASVGNYMVALLVKQETPAVKVVLNGDGADEVLGGYLYMRAAPSVSAFEAETDRLLTEIHRYDVARSERCMATMGLESRSPFLDRQFIAVARGLPTEALMPTATVMEKSILRTAFADSALLPTEVLWRRKEAFSDGISRSDKSWFEMAREEGEKQQKIGGQTSDQRPRVNPPQTAEAAWYRHLWSQHFPEVAAAEVAPIMWMPRFVQGATDPSARTLTSLQKT